MPLTAACAAKLLYVFHFFCHEIIKKSLISSSRFKTFLFCFSRSDIHLSDFKLLFLLLLLLCCCFVTACVDNKSFSLRVNRF